MWFSGKIFHNLHEQTWQKIINRIYIYIYTAEYAYSVDSQEKKIWYIYVYGYRHIYKQKENMERTHQNSHCFYSSPYFLNHKYVYVIHSWLEKQ